MNQNITVFFSHFYQRINSETFLLRHRGTELFRKRAYSLKKEIAPWRAIFNITGLLLLLGEKSLYLNSYTPSEWKAKIHGISFHFYLQLFIYLFVYLFSFILAFIEVNQTTFSCWVERETLVRKQRSSDPN